MPTKEELLEGFTIGEWEILPGHGVFRRGDEEIRPEPLVFKVLYSLAMRDGECVTRDDLIQDAWDGRPTADDPINRSIAQLRSHLGDKQKPHQYVETLHRRGYRLVQPVQLNRESEQAGNEVAPGTRSHPWKAVAGLIAAGFLAIIIYLFVVGEEPEVRSIAVLPIENLSGDPANQYIVAGIKNALAKSLSEIPELAIKNLRVNYNKEPSEIAEHLDVDFVLSCAVQLEGATLKVTYLVSRGEDNVTIGSGEVNGDLDAVFSLQQRLAAVVRDELAGTSAPQLITQYTPDSDAYNSFMRGMYAFEHRGEGDNLESAMALFQESIRLDKYFGPAYLSLATAYALLPAYRNSPFTETNQLAIRIVEMGVAVDENIEDAAGAVYGSVYHKQKKWSESEAAYRRAVSARVVDPNAFNWYSRMLASVGRLDDSLMQVLAAEAMDPDNAVINSRVAIAHTWLGNNEQAHEFFQRAHALGATGLRQLIPYAFLLLRDGQIAQARKLAVEWAQMTDRSTDWIDPVFSAFGDPSKFAAALEALNQASSDGSLEPEIEITARTLLGDIDGAMRVALELDEPGEKFEMDILYAPELQALREHRDFLPLLERIGVVGYWDRSGCKWDGQKARCESG